MNGNSHQQIRIHAVPLPGPPESGLVLLKSGGKHLGGLLRGGNRLVQHIDCALSLRSIKTLLILVKLSGISRSVLRRIEHAQVFARLLELLHGIVIGKNLAVLGNGRNQVFFPVHFHGNRTHCANGAVGVADDGAGA